jgi:hypothetical protein
MPPNVAAEEAAHFYNGRFIPQGFTLEARCADPGPGI